MPRIAALSPGQRRSFAARLRELPLRSEPSERSEIAPEASPEHVPEHVEERAFALTPGQRRLWIEHHHAPGIPLHVVSQIIAIEGAIDVPRLEAALRALGRRHAALRTTVAEVDHELVQTVHADPAIPLEHEELPAAAEGEAAQLEGLARAQCSLPFDLARGPLARWKLVRLGPARSALLFAAHNLVIDAWSFEVLLEDLGALYAESVAPGEAKPGRSAAEVSAPAFREFAAWQRRFLESSEARGLLDAAREALRGPPPRLQADRPREARNRRGARVPLLLPPEVKQGLAALGRGAGATLFMTLATVVLAWIARRTGEGGVSIGTLSANRSRPSTARMVGYLLNPIPVRADLSGDPTLGEALRRVRKAVLGAQAYGELPYETLIEGLAKSAEESPFFDLLFVFENLPRAPEAPGLHLRPRDVDRGAARFDLTLAIYDDGPGLHGYLEYDTGLFDEATAARMAGELRLVAEGVVGREAARLSALPG